MDDLTFDRLARRAAQLGSRREALRRLVGVVIAAAIAGSAGELSAKKKKKKKKKTCKRPNTKCGKTGCCKAGQACRNGACEGVCDFTRIGNTWTLQRDCVAVAPINLENGVTLDGAGHTIVMQGTPSTVPYCIGADGITAHVRNLTLDGSELVGACGFVRGIGIQFRSASGSVKNSALIGFSASCGEAVRIVAPSGAAPAQTVDIDTVDITDALVGINVSTVGAVTLGIRECAIENVNFGIQLQYNVAATIENNEIAATTYGVVATSSGAVNAAPNVTATENTVTGAQIGMAIAAEDLNPGTATPTLAAIDNIIVGRGPLAAGATHGLRFGKLAAGSASGNTISNFFDNGANPGCGIFVAADAGNVAIGANTFPNPPGNEQNECGVS